MVKYMVNAMINISNKTNQTPNVVKARHNLKDKSEAIDFVAKKHGRWLLEPKLRPDYPDKAYKYEKRLN